MKIGGGTRGAAFSLFELLIVIVVIGILVTLLFPIISAMRARAQRVQCTANLRNLYVAAESFIQQNGSWPQIFMAGDSDSAEQDYAKAWIAALKPFGPSEKTWICPTAQETSGNPDYMNPENARLDYFATAFDDKPTTPHQWPTQPWFAEIGNAHGNGQLIIFTDGSVSDVMTIAAHASPSPSRSP